MAGLQGTSGLLGKTRSFQQVRLAGLPGRDELSPTMPLSLRLLLLCVKGAGNPSVAACNPEHPGWKPREL